MIKASGKAGDGTPLLVIGLSGENFTRLLADEPIVFDTATMGLPSMRILILGGHVEDDIVSTLVVTGLLVARDE
ncbi:MAG: hypothetical protein A2V57_01160 [Candidatus Aminicenantes bacterium RBG_19FT_COMBO_65_30]|nr:MAG: hypothetical protein A2V57_01160 [Candidatus Aminicenantes bacterium RBG_19FT_COMBO_65_30]